MCNFHVLFQLMLTILQQQTVYVFTESWSCDQLPQKAYLFM